MRLRLPPARSMAIGAVLATALGLVLFGYRYLDLVAHGRSEPFGIKLIEEMSSAYGIALLVPLVAWWTRRVRRRAPSHAAGLLAHVPAMLVFSFLHTSWNAVMRPLAFAVSGLGAYNYGDLPTRYAMEFWIHIVVYGGIVAVVRLVDERRAAREREQRLIRAEAELSAARLRELEARLHPHFLFNALNTVSSIMYEDVAAADTMLTRLGDLLRRALGTTASEIPLGEELETAQLWLDVMHSRFGDRLHARIDVDPVVRRALVPPLLLQPLIENALKHGDPGAGRPALVDIAAAREDDHLVITVRDNGPGVRAPAEELFGKGVGLDNTRKRLAAMYDGAHRLELANAPDGGLMVTIAVPWREGAGRE